MWMPSPIRSMPTSSCRNASHWVFACTGLRNGDPLRGLLGYEVDAIYGGGPATLERLAHSPFLDHGDPAAPKTRYSDMTIYTAESGALVFATGSIQWSWGLDDYNVPAWRTSRANQAAERITKTVIDRMLETRTEPRRSSGALPSPVVLVALVVAASFVLRAWLNRPDRGTRP